MSLTEIIKARCWIGHFLEKPWQPTSDSNVLVSAGHTSATLNTKGFLFFFFSHSDWTVEWTHFRLNETIVFRGDESNKKNETKCVEIQEILEIKSINK